MNIENITLSEISQSEKDKYCMIPLPEVSGVVTIVEMKVDRWLMGAARKMGSVRPTGVAFRLGKTRF